MLIQPSAKTRRVCHERFWKLLLWSEPTHLSSIPRALLLAVMRAMVVSVSQIATYDQAKTSLAPYFRGFRQHLGAGIVSALTFTTVSMPFDTVKTRVQQARSVVVAAPLCCRKAQQWL